MTNLRTYFDHARRLYVKRIYADHNSAAMVKRELGRLLAQIQATDFVLNVGAGHGRIHPLAKNLDIFPGVDIDYVCTADNIPINDGTVDLIITQEAFEHISNPTESIREIHRVLKPHGRLFFQVPFIIGYHPGPTDYWRFTKEGICHFVEINGFEIEIQGVTVGSASGFYRVSVEFFAILFSGPLQSLYLPLKGIFSLLLYPIKWLDAYTRLSAQNDRIAGGYYCIARKCGKQLWNS